MTREEFATVENLFHDLLTASPGDRERVLQTLSPPTRQLLSELLDSAHRERSEALAQLTPRRFGPWESIRRIAKGGMGEVWLARRADGTFQAEAAIKLLAAPLRLGGFEERFRLEQRILGSLEHPNIARILDGGVSPDGLLYIVMEFVDGLPLDHHCTHHQLDLHARIQLFDQVCRAVSFAHQRLVLHRDLKPSNILVTQDGTAKLLDFGTAKLLAPDSDLQLTGLDARLLTPAYASPEMILGRPLSTASDVWSLGVILYQLLTGRRPLEEPTASQMAELQHVPPPNLNPDLDAILYRALDPDPASRYPQAEDLRADLERFLLGQPVLARRGNWRYRLGKFLRRHRVPAAAAALVLLVAATGLTATLWQARLAANRNDAVRQLAFTTINTLFAEVQRSPGSSETQRRLAQSVIQALDPVASASSGDPELRLSLAQAYLRLARLQGSPYSVNFGDVPGALRSLDQAAALIQGNHSERGRHAQALLEDARSGVLVGANRIPDAAAASRRAYDLFKTLRPNAQILTGLLEQAGFLGDVAAESDPAQALRYYQEGAALIPRIRQLDPKLANVAAPVLLAIKLGTLQARTDPAQALATFRQGYSHWTQLPPAEQTANRRILHILIRKEANALAALKRFPEAQARAQQALDLARQLLALDPKDRRAQFDLAVNLNDFAIQLQAAQNLPAARQATQETLSLLTPLAQQAGPKSPFAANLSEVQSRARELGLQ